MSFSPLRLMPPLNKIPIIVGIGQMETGDFLLVTSPFWVVEGVGVEVLARSNMLQPQNATLIVEIHTPVVVGISSVTPTIC